MNPAVNHHRLITSPADENSRVVSLACGECWNPHAHSVMSIDRRDAR